MTTSEQHATATAYWTVGPEQGELRSEDLPAPGPGEALVRTLYSGISKGTELVVHHASVPECVAEAMAAPNQEGDFPYPVKFGYLTVGVVEDGPEGWAGQDRLLPLPAPGPLHRPGRITHRDSRRRPRPPRGAHRHRGNRRSTASGRPDPAWATGSP